MRLKTRLYQALIGLVQATGFAGGLDYRAGNRSACIEMGAKMCYIINKYSQLQALFCGPAGACLLLDGGRL